MTIREIIEDWFKTGIKLCQYASEDEFKEMVRSRDEALKRLSKMELQYIEED